MYQLCKEPDARKPHVRICGGQVSQGACLPDKVTFTVTRSRGCNPMRSTLRTGCLS